MKRPVLIRANSSPAVRREQLHGRPHIVVPLVMLRETVVNDAFVPVEELSAAGWNGVPVTVDHPTARGQFITANAPRTLEEWAVGSVFNAKLDGDRLKGEAWVDIDRAEEISPGLVAQLESGQPMDVSTGYFPTTIPEKGIYDGRAYNEVHADLKPDHLALLPGDVGACSWADGCGVRVNKRGTQTMNRKKKISSNSGGSASAIARLLGLAGLTAGQIRTHDRSPDNDRRQIVADLIAADSSPFTADDMDGLMWLTDAVLQALRETYLEDGDPLEEEGDGGEEDRAAIEEIIEAQKRGKANTMRNNRGTGCGCGGHQPQANARKGSATIGDMSPASFAQLMANAMRGALSANAEEEQISEIIRLIMEDPDNVFTEEDLRAMPLEALEKLLGRANEAAGEEDELGEEERREELEAQRRNAALRKPKVNFSGRPTGKPSGSGGKKYPSMVGNKAAITGK